MASDTISVTVTLSGSGVDATVYVLNDSTGSMDTVTTTGSDGEVSVTVGDTSAQYHVGVEYVDADSNQYNAVSEPFVAAGDSISFSLDSYTPPEPTAADFGLASAGKTKATNAWDFNTSIGLYTGARGVDVRPSEDYFAVISAGTAAEVGIYQYGDWGSISGSSDAVTSFGINGSGTDTGSPSVSFSPSGDWLVAPVDTYNGTDGETRLFIWDTSATDPTNWSESSFLDPALSPIRASAVDRTNQFVVTTGGSDALIHEVDTGTAVDTLATGACAGVGFSPTQDIVAVGGEGGYCYLYEVGDSTGGWNQITSLDVNSGGSYQSIVAAEFSPNNNWLGMGTMDGTLHLYSVGALDGTGWTEASASPYSVNPYMTSVDFDSQENYVAGTAGFLDGYSDSEGDVHVRTVSDLNQEAHLSQTTEPQKAIAVRDTNVLYTGQGGVLYIHYGPYES